MPWTTTLPYSYAIDYGQKHLGNTEYLKQIEEGRPQLLHVFQDTPLNSWTGNSIHTGGEEFRRITADEVPAHVDAIKKFVQDAHESGAAKLIPYICTMIMVGNAETRDGFWNLYDNWEDFEHLGIGPKPEDDPIEWLQKGATPLGNPRLNHHEPSIHHPGWRQFLRACANLVAECGYDGAFLDVNSLASYLECDRIVFAEYLADRFSPNELSGLLNFSSVDDVVLGEPGDGLLWFETARFRSCAMGKLFEELRDIGRQHVEDFFVIVNNSPMSALEGFWDRRRYGLGVGPLHEYTAAVMFEEMQQAGRFGMDYINDNILQFKYSLAHGAKGVTLLYFAGHTDACNLANAEAASGGGGAFVHPGFVGIPEMRAWGDWFTDHAAMYDGKEAVHDVGVLFFAEQMYWENHDHIDAVYRIRMSLSDNHILFNFLVEPHFTLEALKTFEVVIVPDVSHMSQDQIDVLVAYAEGGGKVLIVGECGLFDDRGIAHATPLSDLLAKHSDNVTFCDKLDSAVPARGQEIYDLPHGELNTFEYFPEMTDRVASIEEAQAARNHPLIAVLDEMAGRRLSCLNDDAPYTLRVDAYKDPDDETKTLVHLVNYDLLVTERGKTEPLIPATDVLVKIPAKSARIWMSGGTEGEPLNAGVDGVQIPAVDCYAIVEVTNA